MSAQGLNNHIIDGCDSGSAPCLLLDAGPASLGAPGGVLVEAPVSDLHDRVSALGQSELWLWKGNWQSEILHELIYFQCLYGRSNVWLGTP